MKIGILGSGNVAKTLGQGLLAKGHEVKLGSRSPEKLDEWVDRNQGGSAGTFTDAASFGEIVFICTSGAGAKESVAIAGPDNFKNKVVIDVTNPLDFSQGMPPKLFSSWGNSLAEEIQKIIPEAHVVKAFNTINCNIMINPRLEEGTATQFIAGNDAGAKQKVKALSEEFGWDIEDLGGLENAYLLETQAMLWILWGAKNNHWTHAFKLLRK